MGADREKRQLLKSSRLFKNFSPKVIDVMVPLLATCHFDEDQIICMKGDESDYFYIIREGEVEVSISARDGRDILLGTLGAGDAFGEVGLLDHGQRTANVSTKTEVSLYRLDNPDFNDVVKLFGIGEFMALNSYICFLFRSITNNLEETAFLDANARIARKVQSLYTQNQGEKDGKSFSVTISQEDLGRMAGLSREAANKALCQLEEQGLLENKYKCITVPDMKKFKEAIRNS